MYSHEYLVTGIEKQGELLGTPESLADYNVTGNGERDSLKTARIGKSAAKLSIERRFNDYYVGSSDPKCPAPEKGEDIVSSALKDAAVKGVKWYYCSTDNSEASMDINTELLERFHEKWTLSSNGCWEWTGATMGYGYGFIKIPKTRKQIGAHRLSYLIHYGELPIGYSVCHVCDNPLCVKPSHLFLGKAKDNLSDMKTKDRHLKGSKNAQSKLTESQVRHIFTLHDQGLSQGKIAKSYGVSQSTVHKILNGQRWEHVYKSIHGQGNSEPC